jgi:type I restriction enzyme R subunit
MGRELKLTDFWDNIPARNRLKGELLNTVVSEEYKNLPNIVAKRNIIINRIMELAETNKDIILYAE